jgi:hypothetical protein
MTGFEKELGKREADLPQTYYSDPLPHERLALLCRA